MMVVAQTWSRRIVGSLAVLMLFHYWGPAAFAQEASVVGTPEQANERIHALSSNAKSSPHDYVIGTGDLLSIAVFDVPELSREVRVSQTGSISIPLVPTRLSVTGLTELQVEQKIAEVLESNGLVSHPEVNVAVKEHKSKPITIVGAVQHPMVYEADRSVTLLEALAEAGGIATDAGDTIIVTRQRAALFEEIPVSSLSSAAPAPGTAESQAVATPQASANAQSFPSADELASNTLPQATGNTTTSPASSGTSNTITVNLNELVEKGDMQNNIPLQAGDVVTVPHAGIVYVLGAVQRPGGFVLSNDRSQLTTMKVLALAGGLTKIAKLDRAVIIRKDGQGKQTQTEIDLKKVLHQQSEDIQMRASDILYIPDSRTKDVLYQALQIGMAVGTAVAIYRIGYQ